MRLQVAGRTFARPALLGGLVRGTTSSFGTLQRPDPRHKESVVLALSMSGVPMICFRPGSAFGTGMVIEGHEGALMLWVQ
jgi:hypothetical protein